MNRGRKNVNVNWGKEYREEKQKAGDLKINQAMDRLMNLALNGGAANVFH